MFHHRARLPRKYYTEALKSPELMHKIILFCAAWWMTAAISVIQSKSISRPDSYPQYFRLSSIEQLQRRQGYRQLQFYLKPKVSSATINLSPFTLTFQFSNKKVRNLTIHIADLFIFRRCDFSERFIFILFFSRNNLSFSHSHLRPKHSK